MSAKPDSSQGNDQSQDSHPPFAGMGAGLGFFQDWMKAAGAAMPGMVQAATQHPAASAWTMPTLDPEELDKRIQELKTVQFWLEQNTRMIAMTIQGLEVQKMTLATLQGMNVSLDKVRESLQAGHEAATTAVPEAEAELESPTTADSAVNPMGWWNSLTQQFTQLASQAAQSVQEATQHVSAAVQPATPSATQAATKPATTKRAPSRKTTANTTRTPAKPKSAASSTRKTSPKS